MSWQWEEFAEGPGTVDELRVTLDRKGTLMIGARAVERLGRPDHVVLLFDRFNSLIGVKPSNRHAPNAYPLIQKINGRHRVVRANRFCRHYGIQFERLRAFVTAKVDENGVLVLDLKETKAAGK